MTGMRVIPILILVHIATSANVPGVEWSQEWIDKIRGKMEFLWDRRGFLAGKFNAETGEYGHYVYDPEGDTTRIPYEKCTTKEKCDHAFSDRDAKFQFSAEKVLRLVFHDCIPYKGEDGAAEITDKAKAKGWKLLYDMDTKWSNCDKTNNKVTLL